MMKKLQFKTLALSLFAIASIWFGSALAQAPVQVIDASSPNTCDGSAYLLDSTANVATISWQGNGMVIAQGVYFVDSLCPGTYVLTYGSPSVSYTFTIGGNGNPCAGFYGVVTTTDVSAAGLCDGTAFASGYNGTAPYTYSWSNGVITIQQGNLCEGQYDCYITDANGCVYTASGYVGAPSTPNDSMLIITNNNFPNSPVLATYFDSQEDCTIDYNAIGNAYASNIQIIGAGNPSGLDTAVVTWTVVDTNNVVIGTYTSNYVISDSLNGVVEFGLLLYCGQKSMNYNSMSVTDRLMVGPLSVASNDLFHFAVVNPMKNDLNITFDQATDATVTVYSSNGAQVALSNVSGQSISIPVQHLSSGIYFVHITANNQTAIVKVLK